MPSDDLTYLETILTPIRLCRNYQPKFGHGMGYTLGEFQALYRADPFYAWFGLDTALMYTAHRAAARGGRWRWMHGLRSPQSGGASGGQRFLAG